MPMELDLGPQAEKFRDEVRQWLEANRPEDLAGIDDERAAYGNVPGIEAWTEKLTEAGYMCVSWPKEFGGRGLTGLEVAVVNEEFARAGGARGARGGGGGLGGPPGPRAGT